MAELATRQHGVASRHQLLTLGLTARTIDAWLRRGRLIGIHPGVYAVGHAALTVHGRQLAAVLACGPSAVLSHGSAGALWDIVRYPPARIHVTVQTWAGLATPRGVRLHRYRSLVPEDLTERDAIPVTTPARTLLDLAPVLPGRKLRRAIGQADVLRRLDLDALDRLLLAHPRRPGAKLLRALLAEHRPDPQLSRSDFEDRLVELCERHGLPRPQQNIRILGEEVDCSWPELRVVAEADSFAFHGTRAAFEKDRARDALLTAAGYRVHRFTDRQLREAPDTIIASLRRSLSIWAP